MMELGPVHALAPVLPPPVFDVPLFASSSPLKRKKARRVVFRRAFPLKAQAC
jgi:hypothetical protein